MDGAAAPVSTPPTTLATTAVQKLNEMAAVVNQYATKYGEAAPEGQLLSTIKDDLLAAATELEGDKIESKEGEDSSELKVLVQKRAAAALVLVAGAVDKASDYDEEYQVTASLAKNLSSAYQVVIAQLAKLHIGGDSADATAAESKTHLQAARDALAKALESAQEHPALATATVMLQDAKEQVSASIATLEEAPLTEKPVVAGLQALHLARQALAGASTILATTTDTVMTASGASATIEAASATVVTARGRLFALLESVTARAGTVLAQAEAMGLSAAVAVDKRFAVVDTAVALDAKYGVSTLAAEGVAAGTAKAKALDAQFGVTDTATAAVEKLAGIDAAVTGGAVTGAVAAAAKGVEAAVAYAGEVGQKFVAAREGETAPPAATTATQ